MDPHLKIQRLYRLISLMISEDERVNIRLVFCISLGQRMGNLG